MSTIPRLYLDAPLASGAELDAAEGQAHHLGTVLRRMPGDVVQLFNARDGEWRARISYLRKDRARYVVEDALRPPGAEPELRLLVAALKRDPMDWLVEKATELGATLIQPVFTWRTVAERVNTDRLSLIARSAAEQCERLAPPVIAAPRPLPEVLQHWDGVPLLVAAERRQTGSMAEALHGKAAPLALLVGPEGGFTGPELDDLAQRPFVATVSLGPRILRAETAAVAGLAAIQALAGDWSAGRLGIAPSTAI